MEAFTRSFFVLDSPEKKLHWTLRISAAFCFIGHGAFGIITKAGWLPYFAVAGIPPEWAWGLMPVVGVFDIALGLTVLISPRRAVLAAMTVWAAWTAMLRPLAGVPEEAMWWEFLERAGNYGVPLALLLWSGLTMNGKAWFRPLRLPEIDVSLNKMLHWTLRMTTALLLIGHGGFGAFKQKPMLIEHWEAAGLPVGGVDPVLFLVLVGAFEILLGILVLVRPFRPLLVFILIWKLFTEFLYPLSGAPFWEFIERWGSYGAPLALVFLQGIRYEK